MHAVGQIGVNYGRIANNLLPPWQVVQLFQWYNIRRMRIYDTDPETLDALRGSGIELTVGVLHNDLECLATSQSCADKWVDTNIRPYSPDICFTHIVVGNEVSPTDPQTARFARFVLPAMQNIYSAVSDSSINVTTAINMNILENTYPPAAGEFRADVRPFIDPIVRFLSDTRAPLFASVYPYFAYIENRANIDIRYALLDPGFPGIVVPGGILYQNLFYAMIDSVIAAVEKSLAVSSPEAATGEIRMTLEVKSSESGWSSSRKNKPPGCITPEDDDVANRRNARAYVNNLIRVVKCGTPMRPDRPIETYIFAMFDENLKPGNKEERHFGMFTPRGRLKYRVNFD
ncbi:glucan endo-1 3-beta-glucosidas [Striga asiatica]|uniref:Glucan endo-1 3-beta-glucosidas n=1 Tax=Striga asiatica TaxID=4170 RepID=A0A5A7P3Y9_STRAF|nr:glucan endo-1 3-beta-glucosidas [Striga asiatica]